jgi:phage baseplate assembly protein W
MEAQPLGTDLRISYKSTLGTALKLVAVAGDLSTVTDLDNLGQALLIRLSTPIGDLAHLGHPDFGSRLHLLIGRLAGPDTTALIRAYVREAVRREPRVAEVTALDVVRAPGRPDEYQIHLSVRPAGQTGAVNLSLMLAL